MQLNTSTNNRFKIKTLTLMVGLALLPALSWAAEQDKEVVLPTVTVTAAGQDLGESTEGTGSYTTGQTRTSTPLSMSLRETPQAVTVVTQQRIEDQHFLTITDVLNSVTGVSVNQYETHRAQFTARGFDINALMIDGVPTTWDQPWSSGEIMSSLAIYDRVEVVRGATGLMTGAGDPSAAVNLVHKRASSKELSGTASLGLGSWNERRAMFDVSTPVNEARTVRARVVGEYTASDSWIDLLKEESKTIFATFEADLGPSTLLSAGYSWQENEPEGSMWGGLPVFYADGSRTHWDRSKSTSADWVRWQSSYQNYFANLEHRFDNAWTVKATYSHGDRRADSRLLYLSGAPDKTTGLGMYAFPGSYKVRTKQDDFGLQANGPFDLLGRTHEAAVGYVNSRQQFNADSRAAAGGMAGDFNHWDGSYPEPAWGPLSYYGDNRIKQEALYGALRLNVTDPLKVILGLRVTNYERSGDDAFSSPYRMEFDHELTPYAGIVYDLNENYSVYASYTDIFQPQQVRDLSGKYLDPIVGKSTEVGVKGAFFEGRLNASLSAFRIKQDNLGQSIGLVIPGTVPPETAYEASSGATSKGFELEVAGEVTRGWNVSAGYSQFKLKDADGEDINTIYPRKLIRLFTSYRLPVLDGALTVGGGVDWQSETYTYAVNPQGATERIGQNDYALVNLMARYAITRQLSAQLNVNNLFDEAHYGMFDAYSQITYGAPRNASLTVNYKF
ncbi:ferric-rhodotorulic acid/ferric-coprogen receptor FhuE [Chitiniphilus shinanonensis]|uniref:Ferric-rhodotorulic acid/ferric-coprogen receptor FhuE n=1 Tax=Chitiniphilus shinanonensis TaxID=553088 RepID=A0ABQ6BWN2_9NEIS|nr:ferric-rhodotorulic acid/ferric-coprogen receptor FhuE [Chitiniphilus shinanonensis]GLS05585.1 ferric-rhodotorulic acid/ferric-coprogen receptor FhuE [Chitiniphilus shinanonensis]